ncbi:MAG: trypsin-like serine peptidase [Thermoanaerobaculia bacterium]
MSKKSNWLIVAALFVTAAGVAGAQDGEVPLYGPSEGEARAIEAYWTPERMAAAEPMPTPAVLVTEDDFARQATEPQAFGGEPGLVNGHPPGGGEYVPHVQTFTREEAALFGQFGEPQDHGTPPTNPQTGPYGPFQRWTMQGKYLPFPRSVHGKLFFSGAGGGNFVCSATVINRSTIATAGHCVSNGSGSFHSNFLFCPSYFNNPTGPNPDRGCWAWAQAWTSGPWHNAGDPDYDYACIVTPNTGTTIANKIGNVTGWAGRAWNWNDVPEITFGYPQGSPFVGNTIQQTASVEWYDWHFVGGGQWSKIIGSDLTGGSSGGGWFLSWRGPATEIPDTDGNSNTDPANAGGPHINGVNSHKRCIVNCGSPPTPTTGVFWQEMTSPSFRNTEANGESEDIFGLCFGHPNNNP